MSEFLATRLNVLRHVHDAMAESQTKQKEKADAKYRGRIIRYKLEDQALHNIKKLLTNVMSDVFKTKLPPRFIRISMVVAKKRLSYTLNLPRKLRTHTSFYVVLLKPYWDPFLKRLEVIAPMKVAVPRIS